MARRKKSVEDLMYDNTVGVATGRTRRRGIQHKSPDENLWGSRNMNAADLKNPKSQYRRMADYRLTGRDSLANGQTAKELVREDDKYRAAYDQAAKTNTARYINHRKKNTQGQGKLMSRNRVSDVMVNRTKKGVGYGSDKTAAAITMTQSGRKKKSDRLVAKKKTVKGRAKNVADIPTRTKANIATKTAVAAHGLKRKVAKKKTR